MARRGRLVAGVYRTAEELARARKRVRMSTSASSLPQDAPLPTGDGEVLASPPSGSAIPKRSSRSAEVAEAAADAAATQLVIRGSVAAK